MSSISNKQKFNFRYKQINHQKNQLKLPLKEFRDDEQYIDFSQQNRKRTRE
jgi:hypothetical protein